ncbi:hypothetical protein ACHAPC_007783 [Botrytis cinerea]|uniref:Similar to salicylate 1-monooxygenase n=2 Tax=Botryotinia fuckeliana TaxID=40559 RepID=G2YNQ1_BOTF4|nr:putative monooxygenase fad-binding protein [Botrytis cinerea BcDW1]CCD53249.1 similar to salicylate 1-monooxygenase [Botrytis cinerea T4]
MSQEISKKVIVVGCGIAGPVIAILLQKKGYTPIVVEKVKELGDAGASLFLQPNGLKVLNLVGLATIVTDNAPWGEYSLDQTHTGEVLGSGDFLKHFKEIYGQPGCGTKRSTFNLALEKAVVDAGIEFHSGWKLAKIEESETSVVAISEAGERIEASFLVGCDGIKAASREILLKRKGYNEPEPTYTGLIQTTGFSPTPPSLRNTLLNVFGPSAHFFQYPISSTHSSWAITQRQSEEQKETWRISTPEELEDQRAELLSQFDDWTEPIPEMIKSAERLLRYGVYDRPGLEAKQWYDGRCILIGDAAHPTSPHLGQGANQAMEDCYHLQRLLPNAGSDLPTEELTKIFAEFAEMRQPKTALLVAGARAQGERRVTTPETMEKRNEYVRQMWKNPEVFQKPYEETLRGPFDAMA